MIEKFYQIIDKERDDESYSGLLNNYKNYVDDYIFSNNDILSESYLEKYFGNELNEIEEKFSESTSLKDFLKCIYDAGIEIDKEDDCISYISSHKLLGYEPLVLSEKKLIEEAEEHLNDEIFTIIFNNINNLSYEELFSLVSINISEKLFRHLLIFVFTYLILVKINNGEWITDFIWNKIYNFGVKKGDIVYLNNNIDELYLVKYINFDVTHLALINSSVVVSESPVNIFKYDISKIDEIKFKRDNINQCKFNIISKIYKNIYNYIYEKEKNLIENKYNGDELFLTETNYFWSPMLFGLDSYLKNEIDIDEKKFLSNQTLEFEYKYEFELIKYQKAYNTLLMAEWVNNLFNEKFGVNEEIKGERDYTFVVVEYIKAVEILLCEKLQYSCDNKKLTYDRKNNKSIIIDSDNWETKVTLGKIHYILLNKEYKNLIFKDISDNEHKIFCNFLKKWIDYTRNDHLHKDLIFSKKEANLIIEDTYKIISQICLLLK